MADSSALLSALLLGQKQRSDPLAEKRKYGQQIMTQGASTAPLGSGHWLEGLSRALQGGVGGTFAGLADREEKQKGEATTAALAKALTANTPEELQAALKGSGADADLLTPIYGQLISQKMQDERANQVAGRQFSALGPQPQQGALPMAPPPGTNAPVSAPPEAAADAQKKIQYLVNIHGIPQTQAAELVGHLQQESAQRPTAVGDGGTAFGLGQWRLDRQQALKGQAQTAGEDVNNPTTQLDFLANELKTRPEGKQFLEANDPAQRQAALMAYFRPAGYTPQNPQAGDGYAQRVQYGQQFAGQQPQQPQQAPQGQSPRGQAYDAGAEFEAQAQRAQQTPGGMDMAVKLRMKANEEREKFRNQMALKQGEQDIQQPNQNFTNAGKLRDDFNQLPPVKNYRDVVPIFTSMTDAAQRGDSRAADLNMIYGIAKIMDPGSVVRESELTLAKNTGTLGDDLRSLYSRVYGGSGLNQATRDKLMVEAQSRFQALKQSHDAMAEQFGGIAQRGGLSPQDVIVNVPSPELKAPAIKPSGPPKAGDVVEGYRFKGGNPAEQANWEPAQ